MDAAKFVASAFGSATREPGNRHAFTYYLPKPIPRELVLMERGRRPLPLLYLSNYFETHRDEYYDRLQAVRERAEIDEWLVFFLRAVREQAEDAVNRSCQLIAIREKYHGEAIKGRSSLPRLVDVIVRNPFVTTKSIQSQLELTNQGARNLIKSAEARGWLRSLGTRGRGGRELWVSPEIFDVLEAPMSYKADHA